MIEEDNEVVGGHLIWVMLFHYCNSWSVQHFLVDLQGKIIVPWYFGSKIVLTYSHWDFLPKFLSLHYYTTLEGVLGVQRSRQAQGTIICLFGPLFFSQNGMTLKKPKKFIKIQWKVTVFWDIIKVCLILAGKHWPKPIR